ncbi:hypothetical protein [Chamaesiphon sp.]|uniref:hypothetical protein n=1 Tax=Chamaesiphon sp. TaxID=2814140 RepID=UPI0035942132
MISCENCSHCHSWNFHGSIDEPPDSGWECHHLEHSDRREDFDHLSSDLEMVAIARDCPSYEQKVPEIDYDPDFYDPTEDAIDTPDRETLDLITCFRDHPIYQKNWG